MNIRLQHKASLKDIYLLFMGRTLDKNLNNLDTEENPMRYEDKFWIKRYFRDFALQYGLPGKVEGQFEVTISDCLVVELRSLR